MKHILRTNDEQPHPRCVMLTDRPALTHIDNRDQYYRKFDIAMKNVVMAKKKESK